jgi:hypothetical protein
MSTNTSTQSQSDSTESQPNIDGPAPDNDPDQETGIEEAQTPEDENNQTSGTEAYDITAQTQMQFGESGTLEPKEDTVEVTLDAFDVDLEKREKETRLDRPEASGLMADDRPELDNRDGGEQANLFADAEEEQQTLGGESAQNQCLFESVEEDR